MRTNNRRASSSRSTLLSTALLFALLLAPAWAQESFRATHIGRLEGSFEKPEPVETSATGIAIMRLDTAAKRMEYRITTTGLVNVTGAHFHSGHPDTTGPVIHAITLPSGFESNQTVVGVWENISSNDILKLHRGTIYINFHTAANPSGEIRSSVDRIPNLVANLSGDEEVPPVETNGSGDALLVLDPAAGTLDYLIDFEGLSGPATAAHFHRGARGVNGPVAQTINLGGRPGRAAGTWSDISAEDMALLLTGQIYVNIHTEANAGGEIRSQVLPIEVYTTAISPANEVEEPNNSTAAGTGILVAIAENPTVANLFAEFIVNATTGPITAAHIHAGDEGTAGPVLRPLVPGFDGSNSYWMHFGTMAIDSTSLLRRSGTYANFHTEQWPQGELRGQLIPAQVNLAPTSSVAVEHETVVGNMLTASVERNTGAIIFRIGAEARGSNRSIALYSSIGTRVLVSDVQGDRALMASENLPAGLYFAQLLVDGRPMGICRVMITR